MIHGVEFRYLEIKWLNKNIVKSMEISRDIIPYEKSDDNIFILETLTYKKYYPRLGIHIQSNEPLHIPYVKNGEGKKTEFIPITDPQTQKIWWIHSDGWDHKNKCHQTETYRTVGFIDLVVQHHNIKIKNNSMSLSVEDLELYLQDIKDDLWKIILDKKSSIKATVSKNIKDSSMFSEDALLLFKDFCDSMDSILVSPNIELKETQEKKPIKQVRPVNRTFRELATKGFQKQLTSRSYKESIDTPDNRYLHFCSYQVLYLVKKLSIILNKQTSILQDKIELNKNNIERNNIKKNKVIDRKVFDDETRRIEDNYKKEKEILSQLLKRQHPIPCDVFNLVEESLQVTLGSPYNKLKGYSFLIKINGETIKGNPNFVGKYAILGMQVELFNWLEKIKGDLRFIDLNIKGIVKRGIDYDNPGKPYTYFYFYLVNSITPIIHEKIEDELSRRLHKRQNYEENGWELALNTEEVKELKSENAFLAKKNKLFESEFCTYNDMSSKIEPILSRLRKINNFFKNHKVKRSASFPSTMSFIQNPLYAKAKSSFANISKLDGMEGAVFDSLFEFDEIGVINVSILYERWCLLQIIKILTEVFGFEMLNDWQNRLIQAVANNQYNIEFELLNPKSNKRITLAYEKILKNNSRPDFVLDIHYQGYMFNDISSNELLYYEQYYGKNKNLDASPSVYEHWQQGEMQRKRFVLDAKFRDNLYESDFEEILKDLMENKNYDENRANQVFLLHPKNDAIREKTSPLNWGKHSDYGQNQNHRKGFIFLLPTSKYGDTLDNLQRLLGMFIQSISYFFDYGAGNFWFDTTCVSCGASAHENFECAKNKTGGGNNSWRITCKRCNHTTVKTVCFTCHRDLYKNQFNLTYHRTKAEQISNIVCPSCQTFLE